MTPDWWLLVGDEGGVMGRRRLGARDFAMVWIDADARGQAGFVLPLASACVGISREGTCAWWAVVDLAGSDIAVFAAAGMTPPVFVKGGNTVTVVDARLGFSFDRNAGWVLAEQVLDRLTTMEVQG